MQDKTELLRNAITESMRTAYSYILEQCKNENIYGLVLCTDSSFMSLALFANTEESLQRTIEHYSKTQPEYSSNPAFKWFCNEWQYDASGVSSVFGQACNIMEDIFSEIEFDDDCDPVDEEHYQETIQKIIKTLCDGIKELNKEDLFCYNGNRNNITVFVSVSDSDITEEVEDYSIKAINPAEVYKYYTDCLKNL